jgi:hypothetical protein
VSCAYYSREVLALLVEDDLPGLQAERVRQHINGCVECRHICEQLQSSQLLIKSRLKVPVQTLPSPELLAGVREAVLSQIHDRQTLGWAVKIERVLMLGIRRHRYAFAGLAVLVIISASLLGQLRHSLSETQPLAAVFDGKDMLLRPERYREWVFVGSSIGLDYSGINETLTSWEPQSFHNVYINPAAYREYAKNGTFPEGTVMVLERVRSEIRKGPGLQGTYEKEFIGLEASVKDSSRFQGGWGFFDFTEKEGKIKVKAQALSDGSCRSCHEERADTDHVFTQFYPVLRSARMES